MAYIVACLAAGSCFLLNRMLLRWLGIRVIVTVSPVVEEMLKTLSAYAFAADILSTHLIFGCIEAVYDWVQTRGQGMLAPSLSVIGHGVFGSVTALTAQSAGIAIGLAAGMVSHLIWNAAMVRLRS